MLLIAFATMAWLWLFFEHRAVKKQLQILRQRLIDLSGRLSVLEQQDDDNVYPALSTETLPDRAKTQSQSQPQPPSPQPLSPQPLSPRVTPGIVDVEKESKPVTENITQPDGRSSLADNSVAQKSPLTPSRPMQKVAQQKVAQQQLAEPKITEPSPTISPNNPATSTEDVQQQATPTWWDKGIDYAKEWISTGNIPVKIGMLVLIAAVIAFLRYATNQGWLHLSIEYKLSGVAIAATAALAFAWTKRHSKRSFSLSVQGGSIGILLLVIFSAVKMYGLLSPGSGFVFSVAAILLAAVLALQQDAKVLAIMAIFAGFLAPIWLSDGSGSHVVLFSYYAALNVGIFIIAWLRPWRELNLLGFVFTYLIGSTWGGLRYEQAQFATTEPFVVLFFLFYLFIPLRYAHRQGQGDSRYSKKIDTALLFGTPLVTLGLQVGMLHNDSDKLALACFAIGAIYAILAWVLRGRDAYETLQKAYVGLAVGFITLAVPIGLSAKATTTIFALEGAAALWLAVREHRRLTWICGMLLQVAAAIAFAVAYSQVSDFSQAIINDYYLSSLLMAAAAWVGTWICYRGALDSDADSEADSDLFAAANLFFSARLLFLWGMAWWLGFAAHEIVHYAPDLRQIHDIFVLLTLTAAALLFAYRYYRDKLLVEIVCVLLGSGLLFALARLAAVYLWHGENFFVLNMFHPVSLYQVITWVLYAAVGAWAWRRWRAVENAYLVVTSTAWLSALATTISTVIYQYLPTEWADSGYYWWAISGVWLALSAVLVFAPGVVASITARDNDEQGEPQSCRQNYFGTICALVLAVVFVRLLAVAGDGDGWWLPILNSVELLQGGIAALLLAWLVKQQVEKTILPVASYLVATALVVSISQRLITHWLGSNYAEITANLEQLGDWYYLAIYGFWLLPAGAIMFVVPKFTDRIIPPWQVVCQAVLNTLVVMLGLVWVYMLSFAGNAAPLGWIPVLNPLAVLQWSILGLVWLWMRRQPARFDEVQRSIVVPSLMLVLISVMTLRFVHHFADVDWGVGMLGVAVTQMALTVVWSILGVVSWIVGSKRPSRPIWLLGAVLMGVVLLKLVLVDRGHLGNLYGILSFFAYGMLCVIVGYFAPVPPSARDNR